MEPSIADGFFFLILSIAIYIYINYVCDEPQTFKCNFCKEVFSELDLKENKCPTCSGEMIEIGKYYQKLEKNMQEQLMYIEYKGGNLAGDGKIGRVTFSKTGKTLYYKNTELQSLKGDGYKENYKDIKTGITFWVSGCKKDGHDTLYPAVIEIDEDVREEYWLKVRELPNNVNKTSFRSEGKYSKRRPR